MNHSSVAVRPHLAARPPFPSPSNLAGVERQRSTGSRSIPCSPPDPTHEAHPPPAGMPPMVTPAPSPLPFADGPLTRWVVPGIPTRTRLAEARGKSPATPARPPCSENHGTPWPRNCWDSKPHGPLPAIHTVVSEDLLCPLQHSCEGVPVSGHRCLYWGATPTSPSNGHSAPARPGRSRFPGATTRKGQSSAVNLDEGAAIVPRQHGCGDVIRRARKLPVAGLHRGHADSESGDDLCDVDLDGSGVVGG